MKLKRFLAIVISLTMVLSIVPAFSLTVGAAEYTDASIYNLAKSSTAVFSWDNPKPNAASDTLLSNAWSDWSGGNAGSDDENGNRLNVAGGVDNPRIQLYRSGSTEGTYAASTVDNPDYGVGNDWVMFSFTAEMNAEWGDVALMDKAGNYITAFRYGTEGLNVGWGHWGWGSPYQSGYVYLGPTYSMVQNGTTYTGSGSGDMPTISLTTTSTQIDILCRKIDASSFKVTYFVDGASKVEVTYSGSFDGLGSIKMARGKGGAWQRISFLKPVVYAGDYPADTTEYTITVNYGTTGTTETLTGLKDATVTAPAKQITVDDVIYVFDSKTYTISGDETVTLEPTKTINAVGGLIAHFSLEKDLTDSVNSYTGTQTVENAVTFNKNGYATFPGGVNQGAITIPFDITSVLSGNFTISMWVKQDSSYEYDSKAVAFWDIAVGNYERLFYQQAGTTSTIQDRTDAHGRVYWTYANSEMKDKWALITTSFDLENGTITNYINGAAVSTTSQNGTWSTKNAPAVFKNGKFYLGHNQWNNTDNPELKGDMAEVRIYNKALSAAEVADLLADKKTVTVKYVSDVDSSEIGGTTVEYFTDSATIDLPTAFTATDGTVYELKNFEYGEEDLSVTVTTSESEYTATYTTAEAVANGVAEIAETVEFIEGNTPILPKTVTVLTNKTGITYTADVTWNSTDSLEASTTTQELTGTVSGYDGLTAKINVIKYPETFSMSDMTAYPGQNTAAIHYFPTTFSGDATIEFDVVFKQLVNGTITIGDAASNSGNCPIFGGTGDAISIQTNSGGMNIRSWGTSGGASSADRNVTTPVVIGDTYRIIITTNTDNDTWSAVMTDKNGVRTVIADGHGYRKVVDKLDSVTVLDNNSKSDTIDVSNFRVYAANPATTLTEYTVNVTGSVTDSYTTKASSANAVQIPYYEGNILESRTIDGTIITFNYETQKDTLGTWAIRNNVTDDTWISEMKYLGTHNSFANVSTTVVNEGGKLRNSADSAILEANKTVPYADDTSTTVMNMSRTQTLSALGQLNAGVRYFDIRLTRQNDGTFWTFHGPAFCDFKPIAATIAQFAKENPGEVIVLDFHYAWDALYTSDKVVTTDNSHYGNTVGDDNQDFYDCLQELLVETGLWDYMPDNWDQKYGALTGNGTKAVVIPVSKARGANCISKFVNRDSATSGDTTYAGGTSISYSTEVAKINEAVAAGAFGSGAKLGIIHAYSTPLGNLINEANNNKNDWIAEENFDSWMARGYGDVLLMNNVTEADITTYLAKLSEYNRDGFNSLYGNEYEYDKTDGKTVNGVTMTGATSSVPFSTSFNVTTGDASSLQIEGYTPVTAYNVALKQFDVNSVSPTGDVTLAFPRVSDGVTTVDVLLSEDGSTELAVAGVGEAISYTTSSIGNYILATKVAPAVNMTVNYVTTDGETLYSDTRSFIIGTLAYDVKASERQYITLGGKAYIVGAEAQSYTVTDADEGAVKTVTLTLIERYAALEDALVTADGNEIYGANSANNNKVFIGAGGGDYNGAEYDDDGVRVVETTPSALTYSRTGLVQFPVVDIADGEAAIAVFSVDSWHGNSFSNSNPTIRLSAYAMNTSEWIDYADATVYNPSGSDKLLCEKPVFSNVATSDTTELKFDVTEFMKAAKAAGMTTLTIRVATAWGGCFIVQSEDAVVGGSQEGRAAYIDVVPANTITVTGATKVTKMGTEVTNEECKYVVPTDASIKVYTTTPYVTDDTTVYTVADDKATITSTTNNAVYHVANLGVGLVNGAQVRIGAGVDSDGKVSTDSGLRFIATVERDASLATVTGATFGVEITAEGNTTTTVNIAADKWQDGETETVFTAALTNLEVNNYNRKFTATPYVKINGTPYYGTPVTRSIYQVAAGLLAKGYDGNYGESEDTTGTKYDEMPEVLVKVLNAYVNQTGIRLQINEGTGLAVYSKENSTANYSGDVFFTVVSTDCVNNVYTITIKPVGDNTTINSYWQDYIRINNNNSAIKSYTSLVDNGDNTVTITFDYAKYLADKAA